MSIISNIKERQIIDSRGNPTVEVDIYLNDGTIGRAAVPSGASTGSREAVELRDGGIDFLGKGVMNAVNNVNTIIAPKLIGLAIFLNLNLCKAAAPIIAALSVQNCIGAKIALIDFSLAFLNITSLRRWFAATPPTTTNESIF